MQVRSQWEQIKQGDSVKVMIDPENSSAFFAPSFLEINEDFSAPEIEWWAYRILSLAALALIAFLVYIALRKRHEPEVR